MNTDFFSLPPFDASQALTTLQRNLRDLKLVERNGAFELKSQPVVRLTLENGTSIHAHVAKRLARSPEWETRQLHSHLDVRKFTDELKLRVARWHDRDE